jgi:hypothetical protein
VPPATAPVQNTDSSAAASLFVNAAMVICRHSSAV